MKCGDRHSEDIPETYVVYLATRLTNNGMKQEKREMYNREMYSRFAIFDTLMPMQTQGVDNFSPY